MSTSFAFLGSHPLGQRCFERLHEHSDVEIEVVVTYSPEASTWWEGSLHDQASALGYDVITIAGEQELLAREFDWLLSVYYPNILGREILDRPAQGALNLHQAELPRYRGSNVFSHSIMNARDDDYWKHGTTLHFMAPEVDSGDIVACRFTEITESDTARSLYEKVRSESVRLFEEQLPHIISGEVHNKRTSQGSFGGERYFYTKESLNDLKHIPAEKLAGNDDEKELYDRIRALDFPPHEPAWTKLNGDKIYLTKEGYTRFTD